MFGPAVLMSSGREQVYRGVGGGRRRVCFASGGGWVGGGGVGEVLGGASPRWTGERDGVRAVRRHHTWEVKQSRGLIERCDTVERVARCRAAQSGPAAETRSVERCVSPPPGLRPPQECGP